MSWLNVFTTTSSLLIGTMGLASLLAAKAYGATEVCITGWLFFVCLYYKPCVYNDSFFIEHVIFVNKYPCIIMF